MLQHSKHLEAGKKYSATRRVFKSLLGVWKCGKIRYLAFDKITPAIEGDETRNLTLWGKDQVETREYLRPFTTSARLKQAKTNFFFFINPLLCFLKELSSYPASLYLHQNNINPLQKWRLNLNKNTWYILSLTFMFNDKGIFTWMWGLGWILLFKFRRHLCKGKQRVYITGLDE